MVAVVSWALAGAESEVNRQEEHMTNPITEFGSTAQRLARNPLGIIALFIVLIYGFAALLFGMSAEKIDSAQRWVFIVFLVLFPVLVLLVFYRLVTLHHAKLYAPEDYKDPKLFLHSLSPQQQRQKLEEETKELDAEPNQVGTASSTEDGIAPRRLPEPTEEVRATHLLAEDLALRQLEEEFGDTLQRHVALKGRPDLAFDGAAAVDDIVYLIEVKYTRRPEVDKELIEVLRERVRSSRLQFKKLGIPGPVYLLFVIVADLSTEDRLRLEVVLGRVMRARSDMDFRLFDFHILKEKFGVESGG